MVVLRNATICPMFHSPVDSHGCVSWKSGLTWRVPVWRIPVWRVPGQILELYGDSKIQLDDLFLGCLLASPIGIITSQVSMSVNKATAPADNPFLNLSFQDFFCTAEFFQKLWLFPFVVELIQRASSCISPCRHAGFARDEDCVKDCNFR